MAQSKAVIEIKGRTVKRVLIWKRNRQGVLDYHISNPKALKDNNNLNTAVAFYTAIGIPVVYYDLDKREFTKGNYILSW